MGLVEWKDEFSVEIAEIDEQHQSLFSLINRLYEGLVRGQDKELLGPVLAELEDYTRVHFKAEEDYFARWEYPAAEKHKLEHETFTRNLHRLKTEFESGVQVGISVQLLSFLSAWLRKHILVSDHQYSVFLKEKAVK